jgi:hypothetical protein
MRLGFQHRMLIQKRSGEQVQEVNNSLCNIKGIVQRKLRWVEIDINRQVLLSCWGAGHLFLTLKEHHLGFYKKHFAAT